jgi:alpha-beta hydrolase superfamily lysophospholipase
VRTGAVVIGGFLLALVACSGGPEGDTLESPAPSATSTILPAASDPSIPDVCLNASIQVARFRTDDGVTLVAVVLGTGTRGVLLAHMGGAGQSLCNWLPFAQTLASKGYLVLDLDLRGFGASGYGPGSRYDLDVLAGVGELRRRGAESVVLMGGSLGAIAVLVGGSGAQPPVDGIVSLSSPADPDILDVPAAVADLRAPVLFVAAEDDGQFGRDARTLYREAASTDKALKIFPGFDHGIDLLRFDLADRTEKLILSFLEDHPAA